MLEDLRLEGAPSVSFGISADNELVPVSNLNGWKITWLSKAYKRVLKTTGLTKRGDFRVRLVSFERVQTGSARLTLSLSSTSLVSTSSRSLSPTRQRGAFRVPRCFSRWC